MDILGLRNLTVIRDACDLIQQDVPDFRIDEILMDDKATYDLFSTVRVLVFFSVNLRHAALNCGFEAQGI